jgi:hypothetical protein
VILQRFSLRLLLLCGFAAMAASAQTVTGVVTNMTDNKPAAGDDVVLLKLVQGMQELARTKTDSRGHYTIRIPASEEAGSMHLVKVVHDGANYFSPVPPNAQKVDVTVYTAAAALEGVGVSEDVMQVQTTPDGGSLRIVQHYLLQNNSQPARTLFNEHPFEVYLPKGAKVDGASAKAPGGMGVEQPLVPLNDPDHYTIIFPIRPGETEFNIWYRIPYTGSFTFAPRLTLPTDALGIMMPKSMNFKQATGTPYQSVSEQVGGKAQAYLARNVGPSQPLGFTVDGKGELPRDSVAQSQGNGTASEGGAVGTATADPNVDTRPGGGLGTPLDKDAERDPWTKYRWWIILGLTVVLAGAAGVMMRTPGGGNAVPIAAAASALDVLRDEMFALETERLQGAVGDGEYAELKSAYDLVLKRALARKGKVEIVPE